MRIFKNKPFARFARQHANLDLALCKAVDEAESGLLNADLGGGIIKQRVARGGSGKSGGFRILILFKGGELSVFLHGFAKNDMGNLGASELAALKKLASLLLAFDQREFEGA